jgi:exopolysaccharide biosynthesis predicted pyruvyltransferase EpsI
MQTSLFHRLNSWIDPRGSTLYVTPRGNAGDAAIATATMQLLRRTGVPVACGSARDIAADMDVIIGGGGNLVPYYNDVRDLLLACLDRDVRRCLLLSHTVRGHADVLARLDARFLLWCRDQPSFEFARQHAPRAQVELAHDLVLELDIGALVRSTSGWGHRLALLRDRRWLRKLPRWWLALARIRPDAGGTLHIMRHDVESVDPQQSRPAYDLMRHHGIRGYGPAADQITLDVVRCIDRAQRVVTDRLHVSLIAALLGKPVCLVENSYGKLSAVWELALQSWPGEGPGTN